MQSGMHLVVTDLDGSLLDHDDYSYEPAKPLLQLLEELRIPLVLASSKTREEMLALRGELQNEHPFIVENGAAVLIPEHYFLEAPADCELIDGHWVRALVPAREQWVNALDELRTDYDDAFENFANAGIEGIAAMTGLTLDQARLANEREYSEPVQWRGDERQFDGFLDALAGLGATVLRGGRFYSVAGDCDKGQAWHWLREQYALAGGGGAVYDLAIGDGGNDVPMLEIAHRALPIPAHGRELPMLKREEGVLQVSDYGPAGWTEGVSEWLRTLYRPA
ncbi:MAG: HAD-IIB family hydrolase [Pseudomonadota bacterium]